MKNDIQLQHDVSEQLEHDWHLGEDVIGVEVHHGVGKLAGRVRDFATMQNVELSARQVEGVTAVVIDIDLINTNAVRWSGCRVANLTENA